MTLQEEQQYKSWHCILGVEMPFNKTLDTMYNDDINFCFLGGLAWREFVKQKYRWYSFDNDHEPINISKVGSMGNFYHVHINVQNGEKFCTVTEEVANLIKLYNLKLEAVKSIH
jgi:hypothetical protein